MPSPWKTIGAVGTNAATGIGRPGLGGEPVFCAKATVKKLQKISAAQGTFRREQVDIVLINSCLIQLYEVRRPERQCPTVPSKKSRVTRTTNASSLM